MSLCFSSYTLSLLSLSFNRRSAVEHELDSSPAAQSLNAVFDETGYFLIYPSLLGIKVVNIETNRVVKVRVSFCFISL